MRPQVPGWLAGLALCFCFSPPASADPGAGKPVDYKKEIAPILASRCLECHGPEKQRGGYRLDSRALAIDAGDSGKKGIVPGKSAESSVVARIAGRDGKRMPPKGDPLTPEQAALITKWIDAGAPYADSGTPAVASTHWSFQPLRAVSPPGVSSLPTVHNPVDAFILSRLEKEGTRPNPPADKATIARRLALDLTGLPLAPERVRAFEADTRPDAVSQLARQLMAEPAYGERMARPWLDLARYADSKGYGSDPLRPYAWRYRDWLIDSFNRNMPYDQFVIEQLAGDLLPGATTDQKLATAFHRNTMTNTEGGTDREEFRTAAVKDRVDTTGQVFLGLTLGCAKCHSHKFDPITQKEYYQFFAAFNQTADNDHPEDLPRIPTPTPDQVARRKALQDRLAGLDKDGERVARFDTPEFAGFARKVVQGEKEWKVLAPRQVEATGGVRLKVATDASVEATGEADKSTYTIRFGTDLSGVQALRLEVLPGDSLPAKGPGLAGGNFVLDQIQVSEAPEGANPVRGRFVRLELPGKDRLLHVAEVQAFLAGENLARKGKATQSTTGFGGDASKAIDGNTDGVHENGSVTHTNLGDPSPWWEVDLVNPTALDRVVIHNRTGATLSERLDGVVVKFLDSNRQVVWENRLAKAPRDRVSLSLDPNAPHTVAITAAAASYEQPGFTSAALLKNEKGSGWAVGGAPGKPATLEVKLARPLGDLPVTVSLRQNYGGKHLLGRFRLSGRSGEIVVPVPPVDLLKTLAAEPRSWTSGQKDAVRALWLPWSPEGRELASKREALKKELAELEKQVVSTPVMEELPEGKKRKNRILVKGNFLDPGDEVQPGVLAAVGPKVADRVDRLALARWIASPENPLTARVQVNRLWAAIFGRGLVETEEDFGLMGTKPSHPELLDWLAAEFIRLKWDNRALLELLVSSATYQQSSVARPDLLAKDPNNILLARFPRRRLEAEAVRDQALAVSGLLSRKVGGPSVYPPQPDGLWQAAFNGERTYPTSKGDDAHRRGIYTFWRRTVPPPNMQAFDAPSREACMVRRVGSNTPLQAFVTLNDPVFVEAAQHLGARMAREGGDTRARMVRGFELCLGRLPSAGELEALVALYEETETLVASRPEAAGKLAGGAPWPEAVLPARRAALFHVANVLLNADAFLTRN